MVSDKDIFTQPISGNKATFIFGLSISCIYQNFFRPSNGLKYLPIDFKYKIVWTSVFLIFMVIFTVFI